jgi:predicted RNA-binding protein with PIN domain
MPYLVDGHNLIPKLGLRLDSLDDENDLISRLQEFCRLRRVQVQVFFDGALPGQTPTHKLGAVTAHFVRKGSSADASIEAALAHMGKTARNWTVVSSDRRVQSAARAAQASVLSSEELSREMTDGQGTSKSIPKRETVPAPKEVEEWLEIFDRKKG